MSLNWKEIHAVLEELNLQGTRLKKIRQPDYSRIILEFSAPGISEALVLVLKAPFVRIHRLSGPIPRSLSRPPRFAAVMKSRLEGLRLDNLFQLGDNRIVRFVFHRGSGPLFLDAKLWGSAPNLVLSDSSGIIIDSFSRRPKSGEVPGAHWPPAGLALPPGDTGEAQGDTGEAPGGTYPGSPGETAPAQSGTPVQARGTAQGGSAQEGPPKAAAPAREFFLRPLEGSGSWNSRVENHYARLEKQQAAEKRIRQWQSCLARREVQQARKKQTITDSMQRFRQQSTDGHWGEICMANLHRMSKGSAFLEAEDWNSPGGTVRIPLREELSPMENARRYFQRQKRSLRALQRLENDLQVLEEAQRETAELKARLDNNDVFTPPFTLPPPSGGRKTSAAETGRAPGSTPARSRNTQTGQNRRQQTALPGLWIHKPPYIIAAGRNAAESDTLLRRWARGNDTWLHIRGRPGAHVFIRAPKGKSIPLEILLDAGNLALSCSGKNRLEEAPFHYTRVKYLRRPKDAAQGTLIPTQEKNLHIQRDAARLEALKELAGQL